MYFFLFPCYFLSSESIEQHFTFNFKLQIITFLLLYKRNPSKIMSVAIKTAV
jgi:hypothetical protein